MGGKRVSGLEDDFVDGLPLPTDSGPPQRKGKSGGLTSRTTDRGLAFFRNLVLWPWAVDARYFMFRS